MLLCIDYFVIAVLAVCIQCVDFQCHAMYVGRPVCFCLCPLFTSLSIRKTLGQPAQQRPGKKRFGPGLNLKKSLRHFAHPNPKFYGDPKVLSAVCEPNFIKFWRYVWNTVWLFFFLLSVAYSIPKILALINV